jgi:Zn-dependent protease
MTRMDLLDEDAELGAEQVFSLVLFALTVLSLLFAYLYWWASETTSMLDGVVFAVTFSVLMGAHEVGHWLTARRHGFAVSLPMFIPFPIVFGTLGAIIAIKERPPNRRAMLEMALAGPAFGFVAMLVVLGLFPLLNGHVETGDLLGVPLLMRMGTWLLGVDCIPTAGGSPLLHGVWLACVVTGLNLVPLRGLDGGRVFQALGFPMSGWHEKVVLAALVVLGLYLWAGWWVWVVVIVLMRDNGAKVADESKPIGTIVRVVAWLTYAVILFAVCVPSPLALSSGLDFISALSLP